jgi:hypothetical protein
VVRVVLYQLVLFKLLPKKLKLSDGYSPEFHG